MARPLKNKAWADFKKHKNDILRDLNQGLSYVRVAEKYKIARSTLMQYTAEHAPAIRKMRDFAALSQVGVDVVSHLADLKSNLESQLAKPPNEVAIPLIIDPTIEVTEADFRELPILNQVSLRAAIANQQLTNQLLYKEGLNRADLKMHAEITKMNDSVITGQSNQLIQIQINNREKDIDGKHIKALPLPQELYDVEVIDIVDEED